MQTVLLVGAAGFVGAILRYILVLLAGAFFVTSFPVGTLLVNLIGSFLAGGLVVGAEKISLIHPSLSLAIIVGLLGSFTTFSAFSNDSLELLDRGELILFGLNICLNVFGCISAAYLGRLIAKATLGI